MVFKLTNQHHLLTHLNLNQSPRALMYSFKSTIYYIFWPTKASGSLFSFPWFLIPSLSLLFGRGFQIAITPPLPTKPPSQPPPYHFSVTPFCFCKQILLGKEQHAVSTNQWKTQQQRQFYCCSKSSLCFQVLFWSIFCLLFQVSSSHILIPLFLI